MPRRPVKRPLAGENTVGLLTPAKLQRLWKTACRGGKAYFRDYGYCLPGWEEEVDAMLQHDRHRNQNKGRCKDRNAVSWVVGDIAGMNKEDAE